MVCADNLTSFFVSLELLSVPLYGMLAYTYARGKSLKRVSNTPHFIGDSLCYHVDGYGINLLKTGLYPSVKLGGNRAHVSKTV